MNAEESPSVDEIHLAQARLDEVRKEVARVYVGPATVVDYLLIALLAQGHVLLEGVPGVAKTTLVKTFAAGLGCTVRRVQFTADLLPADITGTYVLSPREGTFAFRAGPIFANVVLADEINRAPPKTQAALLEAMQEHQVTVEGDRYALPSPFLVLATQNPIDFEGTYPLPEAQIDRFLLQVSMGYPSRQDEVAMLRMHGGTPPATPVARLEEQDLLALQAIAARVYVESDLLEYAVGLCSFTRSHPRVALGASPRATLALVQAAKAASVLAGRSYVTPDDIREIAPAVLAHRLVLTAEAEGDARARTAVIRDAVAQVGYRKTVRPV